MSLLKDNLGRNFYYLRLSITELCNFRCSYCLPNGCDKVANNPLTPLEIKHLLSAFADLGVSKVRITGGEPTVRQDFLEILKIVNSIKGINERVLTTNGYKLEERALSYFQENITGINVSVDSLNPNVFYKVTGGKSLQPVLSGIMRALEIGFAQVKINAVLLKGINDNSLDDFLELVKDNPVSVRFIELMQTGNNLEYFKQHHISASILQKQLLEQGWNPIVKNKTAGPAIEYQHEDYKGRIGVIAPYSKDFCTSCNRLRVSAQGELFLCLFGKLGYPLRDLLQQPTQKQALQERVLQCLEYKLPAHLLQQGIVGARAHFSSIGG